MESSQNTPAYKVVSNFNLSTVYLDPDIQRPSGNWDKDPDLRYSALRAYNTNRMTSPIVLADAQECLSFVKKTNPSDIKSIKYYEDVLARDNDEGKTYRYICLDGQHRLFDVLCKFFNGEWAYTGKLRDADGQSVDIKNKFFNQMPTRVKDSLNDCLILIRIFADMDQPELPEVFIDHQKGIPLNAQQKRRAKPTPLTPWIRVLAAQNANTTSLLSKCAFPTCEDEEFIAKLLIATNRSWGGSMAKAASSVGESSLNRLYISGATEIAMFAPTSPYIQSEFRRFEDIFDKFAYTMERLDKQSATRFRNKNGEIVNGKRLGAAQTWSLWWAMELIIDEGYSINDVALVFESVNESLECLKNKTHIRYAKDVERAESNSTEKPVKRDYFWYQIACINQKVPSCRISAQRTFVRALKKNAKFNQGCSIVQIPTAAQLTLELTSAEAPAMQEPTL